MCAAMLDFILVAIINGRDRMEKELRNAVKFYNSIEDCSNSHIFGTSYETINPFIKTSDLGGIEILLGNYIFICEK